MTLRPMRAEDLGAVNKVLSSAFTQARWEMGFKTYRVPPCRPVMLRMYLQRFPGGNFVLEHRRKIVGFVFSHLWGKVGWLGPVAVLPEKQGRGLGRQLVQAGVEALKAADAVTIGLETLPNNFRNLRFYTRMGFVPTFLTVDLNVKVKNLPSGALDPEYSVLRSQEMLPPLYRMFDALAQKIDPALAVGREIELLHAQDFGGGRLLVRGEKPVAFALAHTEKYYSEEPRNFLKVFLGGVSADSVLPAFLQMVKQWAREESLENVILRLPTRHLPLLRRLMEFGFHPIHTDLRLVLDGYPERSKAESYYFNKWE